MPKKVKKRAPNSESKKKKPAAEAPNGQSSSDSKKAPGNSRFVNDLLARGEAAELTKDGKLPLPATHVISKKNPDGTVEVKRARYKLF